MKSVLPLLLLLAACPMPEDEPELKDTAEPEDTDLMDTDRDDTGETTGEDADWWGGCEYTATRVGADEVVGYLEGTPAEFAARVSGARGTTFHFDGEAIDTTLDHTLTVDASTAVLYTGVWVDGDTGWGREDTGWDDDMDTTTDTTTDTRPDDEGGGEGEGDSGGGEDADPPEEPDEDTGRTDPGDPGDTGFVEPDTGGWVGEDTGATGPSCPDYLTAEADWTFSTGDGSFAEDMRVTVHARSLDLARIDHDVDVAVLGGTFVAPVEDPASWDELRVIFSASVGTDVDRGEVGLFGSRTWSGGDDEGEDTTDGTRDTGGDVDVDTAADTSDTETDTSDTETEVVEAFMGNVARWPVPGDDTDIDIDVD